MTSRRGMTLIEAMMSMGIGAIGIVGVVSLLLSSASVVRRTNTQAQALMLAQRELETISSRGCNDTASPPNCDNIKLLDRTNKTVWLSTTSGIVETAPVAGDPERRPFHVAIDVDGVGQFEGAETGDPMLTRPLDYLGAAVGSTPGVLVNVRVTVSWEQPVGSRRAVALQTRMAP